MCVNQVEYEDNYADNYDNEILQDQQGGEWSLVLLLLFTRKVSVWFHENNLSGCWTNKHIFYLQ